VYVSNFNNTGSIYINNYREYLVPGQNYPPQIVIPFQCSEYMTYTAWSQYREAFSIPYTATFLVAINNVTIPLINNDFSNSTLYAVEYVLELGVDVLVLVGQDDMNLHYPGQMNWVNSMSWSQIDNFRDSPRSSWSLSNGTIGGTYKKYENLNFAVVYKAGHIASFDQPPSVLQVINNFISDVWST